MKPPTLREFAQQFGGAYLSTEGALWRTLKLLLFKPGELTVQYLAGRRKHYVLPLRLYLTVSVLTLLLLRTAGGPMSVNLVPDAQAPALRSGRVSLQVLGNAGLKDGVFYCHRLPGWVCQRLKRRLDVDPRALALQAAAFKDRFTNNLGGGMFLLLPGFALWMKLAYCNRRLRYAEHLVFALHIHAFWFLALAFTVPDRLWLSIPAFTAVPWYTFVAMRRVYGGRRWPRLLRGLLVSLLYGLTLVLVLTGTALWSLLM
ncbi:MAG: DUF3667 domain-containing protein [Burkholderiales bacterium]|nr:DUF3667 domain-containing protein [Burkholderiales bacterium]